MTDEEMADRERRLLRQYVEQGKLMQVATTSDHGSPWLAHCWYAADSNLSLVFMSRTARRHSLEIRNDPRVAGGIVSMDLQGLGQKVRGVIFEGAAEELVDGRADEAYDTYRSRWPQVETLAPLEALRGTDAANRLWRITPSSFILFDEVNFPSEPRRTITEW
jgi:uncharacterized protein YhbP (UPF0306 family)